MCPPDHDLGRITKELASPVKFSGSRHKYIWALHCISFKETINANIRSSHRRQDSILDMDGFVEIGDEYTFMHSTLYHNIVKHTISCTVIPAQFFLRF